MSRYVCRPCLWDCRTLGAYLYHQWLHLKECI